MKRKPAYLQVTRKCNNECIFCSNPQFEKEITLEEAKEEIKKFKSEGVTDILMTGGEPTSSPHLKELIKFSLNTGLKPKIITNGVNLSDLKLVKELKEAGLNEINVSLHSHIKEVADMLSQKDGHLEKTMQGIRNSINTNINVTINSTINSKNIKFLPEFARYMIKEFPEIKHFVFNNLDPGYADGNNISRAAQNPEIIAKLTDIELNLSQAIKIFRVNGKTFRVERIPLCYMQGFEEFSTETRKIVKDELYMCSFIEKENKNKIRIVKPKQLREKTKCCSYCFLEKICAGVQKEYLKMHGPNELFPVFINPDKIIERITTK